MRSRGNVCPAGVSGLFPRTMNRQDTYPQTKHSDPELQPKTPMCSIRAREAAAQVHIVSPPACDDRAAALHLWQENDKRMWGYRSLESVTAQERIYLRTGERFFFLPGKETFEWVCFFLFFFNFKAINIRRPLFVLVGDGKLVGKAVGTDSILTRLFFLCSFSFFLFF